MGVINPDSSRGGSVVLTDEAAEHVPATNIARTDPPRVAGLCERWREVERAMGSPAVVVLGVGPKRPVEVAPTEDKGPIDALGADGLDHALGRTHSRSGPGSG